MQKCFYHAKTDAVTMCMGCKMPICATCRDEGKKGFCENCMKKVASLSEAVSDTRKTGMVQSSHKATMIKTAGRATAPKNVTYCFHHFDIVASATCPTCNRPFCPACLNTAGVCSHCARHNPEAQERLFSPNERGRRVLEEVAAAEAKKRWQPRHYAIAVAVVLAMIVAWKHMHRPVAQVDETTATLAKLHANELTPAQEALLAKVNHERHVAMPSPPPVEAPAPQHPTAVGHAVVGGGTMVTTVRHGAHAAGGARPGSSAVHVAVLAPGGGATVSGVTAIKLAVNGAPGRIDLLVDGQWTGTLNSYPYKFDWASQAVSNGPHRLTVQALGEAGLLSQSSISVKVSN